MTSPVSFPPVRTEPNGHVLADASAIRLLGLLPSIPLGGMERAALNVLRALAEQGATVHVLAERRWGTRVQQELDSLGLAWSGINHVAGLTRPRTAIELRANLLSYLLSSYEIAVARQRHRASTLLATSETVALRARRSARRSDTIGVFRIPNPPLLRSTSVRDRLKSTAWRAIGESYDHLVCNSHYTARLVAEATGDRGNVRVVRNYPPILRKRIEVPAPRLEGGRRHVIFLGQIAISKGVDVLFEAARILLPRLPDVSFALAGPTIWLDPYMGELARRIGDAGIADRFVLLGPVDDVQGILRQGAIHVCPSISPGESFPNSILDAKQAGLPSVVLPTAGLPEAVVHGIEGIVTADHSGEALADGIRQLLEDDERRRTMGAAASASLARHDPATLTKEWVRLFASPEAP